MIRNMTPEHPNIPILQHAFEKHQTCFLLPTYNNASSIVHVIHQCLEQTANVLVVNDGSTDDTLLKIEQLPIKLLTYPKNRGKGYALRQGFKRALELGYRHVITIDTDGQHYAEDAIHFFEVLEKNPDALLIGSRNLNQENVPGKSSFGNRFSNFWFKVETGKTMPDTQSGYRLYPVHLYQDKKWVTNKYEFEIEVIVRSSWMGIDVLPVPIRVFYPKQEERISHFRPFKDFSRISVLNTVLVLIAFFYIKPRDLVLRPLREKGFKRGLKELLFDPHETIFTRAASVGFGVFMGIVPVWGFQLLIGIPAAVAFKLNKTLFIVAANISIFPPIIWAASLATGKLLFGNPQWRIDFKNLKWEEVLQTGKEFFIGGTVLSILAGLICFAITYFILSISTRKAKP